MPTEGIFERIFLLVAQVLAVLCKAPFRSSLFAKVWLCPGVALVPFIASGSMVLSGPLWSSGPVVLWSRGFLVRWSCGLLVRWSGSPVVPRSLVPRSGGPHHEITKVSESGDSPFL